MTITLPAPVRRLSAAVCASALAVALVSCSSDSGDSSDSDGSTDVGASGDSGANSSSFPVTIDSALGSATIEEEPERVVTIGWGSQDIALALGVTPVGMPDMSSDTTDGTGILPWDREHIDSGDGGDGGTTPELLDATSDDLPYEDILNLEPDVILAVNSGVTDDQYSRLSDIAPTVAYPGEAWQTSWEDQTTIVGEALGRSEQAEKLVDDTHQLIADAKAEHPEFEGKTIAFASGTTGEGLNTYLATDSRISLLEQLGFTVAPSVPTTGDSFAVQVSKENWASIDSDVLVSWYLSEDIRESLESDPGFARIPAVEHGGYVPLTDPPMVYATSAISVLSLPWMLDNYLPLLQSAAEGESPL
ncbi:iron siderophore-binding protein [Corynebacterium sp. CNJ-954]|uniref:iron-siderophore ABC transporter substrate-binding protein n=1 Tax=Corynebacterium sp. CNJ-954 TaxID=1904962 RepID=UPI0009661198|nr:iron-siderophore ABC transporter substrate-binding protein [Corynebacterium sp. CNJ-954]OLT52755.1 iron siderophore-binding protein [Corynebacterium sp. CNJ-954]